jgi:DNA-binding IclR family transcriptional regulator
MKANPYLSLQKGFRILELLAERAPRSVSEIADALDLEMSNTSRLLKSLAELGYATQGTRRGLYQLSPRILKLAGGYLTGERLLIEAQPVLKKLALAARASAHLGVLVDNQAIVVAKEPSPERLQVSTRVGGQIPLHASALGKILLASLDEEPLERALKGSLEAFTSETITRRATLRKAIAEIRRCGYVFESGEEHPGIGCIGAPIHNVCGQWMAAISVAGPLQGTPFKLDQVHLALVVKHADELSKRAFHFE